MSKPRRYLAIGVSLLGVGVCATAVAGFVQTIVSNNLQWPYGDVRDHYIAVGESYMQGFTAGFFLCLFLVMAVVVIAPKAARR